MTTLTKLLHLRKRQFKTEHINLAEETATQRYNIYRRPFPQRHRLGKTHMAAADKQNSPGY
jgi:hypothetical protein